MKSKLLLFGLSIFIFQFVNSQSWTHESGESTFDGNYRTSSVRGTSTDGTYKRPLFVVNNFDNSTSFNIYLTNVGYFCDNVTVKIRFDKDPITYTGKLRASNKQEIASFDDIHYFDDKIGLVELVKFEFLALVMRFSNMHIRLSDDCDQTDLQFSLSGSTKAIKYVYGPNADKIDENIAKRAETKAKKEYEIVWRKNLSEGDSLLVKLNPGGKYVPIYSDPTFRSTKLYKIVEDDTAIFILNKDDMTQIIYNDTIKGWIYSTYYGQL